MESVTLEDLRMKMAEFARERDWDQFHSPRNLLLALVGEVGELSEIFQWRGEVPRGLPGWEESHKEHLGEELSDVLLYLIRLSDICGVDLSRAALRKMQLNAIKYPVKHCKGSSRKHNHYSETAAAAAAAATTTNSAAAAAATTTNSAAAAPPLATTDSVSGDVTSTDGSKNICNGGGAEEVAAAP